MDKISNIDSCQISELAKFNLHAIPGTYTNMMKTYLRIISWFDDTSTPVSPYWFLIILDIENTSKYQCLLLIQVLMFQFKKNCFF